MKKSSFPAVLGFCIVAFLLVSFAPAGQRDIPVPDAGFEDHVLTTLGGWIYIGDSGYTGAWKNDYGPDDGAYIDYHYWDGDLPARSGSLKAYPSDGTTFDYIYQILDETFVEGDTYILSVWAGNAWPGEGYADGWGLYFTAEDYTINLIEEHGLALSGDWEQISLEYTATAADAGNRIGIKMSGEEGESYVAFDDVTLTRESLVPMPLAYGPEPGQGEMIEATVQLLAWRPGDLAASHNVYFGDNFDDVNQATPDDDAFKGNQSETLFAVQNLTPGATYYWRIDEVNDLDSNSPWKGEVWDFHVEPAIAWAPSPADGGQYVLTDPTLTWEPGLSALFHTLYIGESFDDVSDATTGGYQIVIATHEPGPLVSDTTYYWRVDEFDATATTHKGEVWSFTTVPDVAVTDPTLVGWWTLDEGEGTTAVDWSGHGNHGVLIGNPQWVDGYHGGALDFDGNDHVDTGNATDLATWTIAAWVTSPRAPSSGSASGPVHREKNYQLDWNHADEVFRGAAAMRVGETWHAASFGALEGNTWYHLAATFDGTALTSYKNGVLVVSNTAAAGTPDAETGTLLIGRHSTASGNYFAGTVDDVRVYDRALTEAEIAEVMRGKPLLAGNPEPDRGAGVDVLDATTLRWSAGDTAASHDVYFGTDRAAVAAADNDAPEFRGNQPGTGFSLAGLVEFGGGDYFWRIDEVEAAGTVHTGYIWKFTVPDHLIVDDFESYTNEVGSRVFEKWIDGIGFTQPEPGHPGNGTGAAAGHDIWSPDTPYTTIVETDNVYGGTKAMPIYYTGALSEADRTFTPGRNWTVEGVTTLVVHFRGQADNTGDLYVKINGVKVPYDGNPADIASYQWVTWEIDLASVGVSLTNVTTLTIGIEAAQEGVLYVDEIVLTRP
ncbi:MAG: LamG domain-containing protein [Sedimentisphaerales bacterium]|nr:LamG domain-containing protein [Sedimentisphaerales bacterium]